MTNIFQNTIAYKYNDMSHMFYEFTVGGFSTSYGWTADSFSGYLVKSFIELFGPILGLNLLTTVYIAANLLSSYFLFKKVHSNKIFSVIFSILYSFSIFFLFRVISLTPNLYPIFIFPLTLYLLIGNKKSYYLGVLNFFFLFISSYFAFFNTIVVAFWYLIDKKFSDLIKFSLPLLVGLGLFFLPYLRTNSYLGDYSKNTPTTVYRPIEDWYNFSLRPWYFLVPPGSSVYFADLHNKFYNALRSTNNYLLVNYSEDEMAGSYMGWHFVLGAVIVFYIIFLNRKYFDDNTRKLVKKCFLIISGILLISGPPTLTISGIKIYTPSLILYYVIPVFRSLARWSSVIYLLVLIINYTLVLKITSSIRAKVLKLIFIAFFVALNYVVFAIRIPLINTQKPPVEIVSLASLDGDSLVFYPNADYYILFWSQVFNKKIINPEGTFVEGLSSEDFSDSLLKRNNRELFSNSNTRYLIYNQNAAPDDQVMVDQLYGQSINAGNGFYIYSLR